MRLDEQRAPLRVEAQREQLGGRDAGALAQRLRVVLDGDRVQVDDAVERVVVVLQRHPLPQRTEVVAEMERVRGGLDAGEHPRASLGSHRAHSPRRYRPGGHRLALVEVITVGPGLAARSFPGDGRPVLLVHGLSSNARLWTRWRATSSGIPSWRSTCAATAVARRCPTTSRMPPWPPPTTSPSVCDDLGWSAPVVAGQSWGGNVGAPARGGSAAARDRAGRRGVAAALRPLRHDRRRPGRCSRRRGSTGSPPRPSAPGSARATPGWSDEAVEATSATCEVHVDGAVTPGSPGNDTARSSAACSRPPAVSCTRRSGARSLLLVAERAAGGGRGRVGAPRHAELVAFPGGDDDLHAQHPEQVAALIGRLA